MFLSLLERLGHSTCSSLLEIDLWPVVILSESVEEGIAEGCVILVEEGLKD